MQNNQIHIDEENTHLFWGLIAVVSIASATYMLTNAFMTGSWSLAGYMQLISLLLFSVGFYGIIRISSPLFHFVLSISGSTLRVEIWQEDDQPVDIKTIDINAIGELRIAPHSPRLPGEALYDFSTSYYLLFRGEESGEFQRLISLEGASFTLKVEDIGKVMNFLVAHNRGIHVPESDRIFVELNPSGLKPLHAPNEDDPVPY